MGTPRKTVTKGFMYKCVYEPGRRSSTGLWLSQGLPPSWPVAVVSQHLAELFRVDFPSSFNAVYTEAKYLGEATEEGSRPQRVWELLVYVKVARNHLFQGKVK